MRKGQRKGLPIGKEKRGKVNLASGRRRMKGCEHVKELLRKVDTKLWKKDT